MVDYRYSVSDFLLDVPGALAIAIVVSWAWEALDETIKNLQQTKQIVKTEVFVQLKMTLVLVAGGFVAFLLFDMIRFLRNVTKVIDY